MSKPRIQTASSAMKKIRESNAKWLEKKPKRTPKNHPWRGGEISQLNPKYRKSNRSSYESMD